MTALPLQDISNTLFSGPEPDFHEDQKLSVPKQDNALTPEEDQKIVNPEIQMAIEPTCNENQLEAPANDMEKGLEECNPAISSPIREEKVQEAKENCEIDTEFNLATKAMKLNDGSVKFENHAEPAEDNNTSNPQELEPETNIHELPQTDPVDNTGLCSNGEQPASEPAIGGKRNYKEYLSTQKAHRLAGSESITSKSSGGIGASKQPPASGRRYMSITGANFSSLRREKIQNRIGSGFSKLQVKRQNLSQSSTSKQQLAQSFENLSGGLSGHPNEQQSHTDVRSNSQSEMSSTMQHSNKETNLRGRVRPFESSHSRALSKGKELNSKATVQRSKSKEQEENASQHHFKASGIPDYSKLAKKGINTKVKPMQITTPIEPKFHTDQRASLKQPSASTESQKKVENSHFKALPMPNLSNPFTPKIQKTTPTECQGFQLQSDKRAKERKHFDEKVKIKVELSKKAQEEEKRRKEEEEIKEIRKSLMFKATPIHHYSEIQIKKSDKPLVQPQSPKFHVRERSVDL